MGTLYYFHKQDGSDELFALNKVYQYADPSGLHAFDQPKTLASVAPTLEAFVDLFWYHEKPRDWALRMANRLYRWAGDAPIRMIDENQLFDLQEGLSDEEQDAKITGSTFDSDYESDGVTYIPGSAF